MTKNPYGTLSPDFNPTVGRAYPSPGSASWPHKVPAEYLMQQSTSAKETFNAQNSYFPGVVGGRETQRQDEEDKRRLRMKALEVAAAQAVPGSTPEVLLKAADALYQWLLTGPKNV